MLYAMGVVLAKDEAVYEEKEKFHYFTHQAQNTTNSHPHLGWKLGMWEKYEIKKWSTPGTRKSKQKKKTGGKLKESILN